MIFFAAVLAVVACAAWRIAQAKGRARGRPAGPWATAALAAAVALTAALARLARGDAPSADMHVAMWAMALAAAVGGLWQAVRQHRRQAVWARRRPAFTGVDVDGRLLTPDLAAGLAGLYGAVREVTDGALRLLPFGSRSALLAAGLAVDDGGGWRLTCRGWAVAEWAAQHQPAAEGTHDA